MEMKNKESMNHQKMLQLRWLRWASLAEGLTLVLLVCIAVPLKRMAGMPEFVSALGPLHGGAFLIYLAMVARAPLVKVRARAPATAWVPGGNSSSSVPCRRASTCGKSRK